MFGLDDTQTRWLITIAVVIGAILVHRTVIYLLRKRMSNAGLQYRASKVSAYIGTGVVIIVVAQVWLRGADVLTYLGIVSAGLAIALSDVLKNVAGWMYILGRHTLEVGDRIEIGAIQGDVVDIRLLRFSVIEIGNWVEADQSTGRLVHIPNGLLFTTPMFNYTTGFSYIWHEVKISITFESDVGAAEQIVRDVLAAHIPDLSTEIRKDLQRTAPEYRIQFQHFSPITYVTGAPHGVIVTARFMIPVRQRRAYDQMVWKPLLKAIREHPDVHWAYPTQRTVITDPLSIDQV
jgi:small-conductance mechanosensitive channel